MYTAKVIEKIDNGKGYWNYLQIGVYNKQNELVTSYKRNYSSFYNTFHPFKHENNWYALFSQDYVASAVMELPSGKVIAEEPRTAFGFCPTDFYIPRYQRHKMPALSGPELEEYPIQNWSWLSEDRYGRFYDDYSENQFCNELSFEEFAEKGNDSDKKFIWLPGLYYQIEYAFVAGCVWGDDSSWKIQRLDLSNFLNGEIKRSDAYGYFELASGQSLKEAISVCDSSDEKVFRFRMNTPIDIEIKDNIVQKKASYES